MEILSVEDNSTDAELAIRAQKKSILGNKLAGSRMVRKQSISSSLPMPIVRVIDGAECWVMGIGKIEYSADGVALRMTGIVQDITEHKHLEQEREQYFRFFQLPNDLIVYC